jgi:hypothetical protein
VRRAEQKQEIFPSAYLALVLPLPAPRRREGILNNQGDENIMSCIVKKRVQLGLYKYKWQRQK